MIMIYDSLLSISVIPTKGSARLILDPWIPWTLWNNLGPNSNYTRQMVGYYVYNVQYLDLDCCSGKTNGNFTALQQVGKNV